MAELVQKALDEMVAPLLDLQQRGLFQPHEIQSIVQTRRDFEYKLRRRHVRLSDMLAYIQYETQLEDLRRLRSKKQTKTRLPQPTDTAATNNSKQQRHDGDTHILQHLHRLWLRLLRKFKSVEHYIQYAAFCNQYQSFTRLSACHQDALRLYPKVSQLYSLAASHEYFHNHSIRTARIYLQKGLRNVNVKKRVELWLQSFVLELHFVQKVQGRQWLLLPNISSTKNNKKNDPFRLAKLVYQHAIKESTLMTCCMDQWKFVQACQEFPHTLQLQQDIVDTIDECGSVACWMARVSYTQQQQRQQQQDTDREDCDAPPSKKRTKRDRRDDEEDDTDKQQVDPVVSVLETACAKVPTSEMYSAALRFLMQDRNAVSIVTKFYQAYPRDNDKSNELVLLYADYIENHDSNRARTVLEEQVKERKNGQAANASVWVRLAQVSERPMEVLTRALNVLPVDAVDHVVVLVQQWGLQLLSRSDNGKAPQNASSLFSTLQKVLLLSAGRVIPDCDYPLAISNIAQGCYQHVELAQSEFGVKNLRKVYQAILFQSNILQQVPAGEASNVVTAVLEAEPDRVCRKRIYKLAMDVLFKDTKFVEDYRRQRDNDALSRPTIPVQKNTFQIPALDASIPGFRFADAMKKYKDCQIVVLRNVQAAHDQNSAQLSWTKLGNIFQKLQKEDKDSWCIETNGGAAVSANKFLCPKLTRDRAYCSFLVQKDQDSYQSMLEKLPFRGLDEWNYETALWIFFGRNPLGNIELAGRPDHTDSVSHDGTFHYQLSGVKEWFVRPTEQLLRQCSLPISTDTATKIECRDSDVIVVNTRLWFHRTSIPPQKYPSVSYARDFRLENSSVDSKVGEMMNVDGLYATNDVGTGTIVFTESDIPSCELHRSSTNPNCHVVELEDGTSAVVSIRPIASGEFFTVPESDNDDSSENGDSVTDA